MVDSDTIKAIARAISEEDTEKFKEIVGNDHAKLAAGKMFGSWLHIACSDGSFELVKYLVDLGFDVNATNEEEERSPLILGI